VVSGQEKKVPSVAHGVEGLLVFQRAYAASLDVHRASLTWPRVEQYGGIADQIRRSSKSVCALLAEGVGRSRASRREFERYLVMALGSADEVRLWCRYAEDLGYTTAEQAQAWRASYAEIARMLQGLIARPQKEQSRWDQSR
jgi:four helix bundle protein